MQGHKDTMHTYDSQLDKTLFKVKQQCIINLPFYGFSEYTSEESLNEISYILAEICYF